MTGMASDADALEFVTALRPALLLPLLEQVHPYPCIFAAREKGEPGGEY